MRQYLKYLLLAAGIIIILFLNPFLRHKFDRSPFYVIRDTSLISRVEKNFKQDTVIKIYEKVIYSQVKPKVIYIDRIDSNSLKKWKQFDLMLKLQKKYGELTITALNQQDSVIKEYRFDDVSDNFSVTAKTGDVFVKSSRFEWKGLKAGVETRYAIFDDEKWKVDFLLNSEVSIAEKIGVGCVMRYPLSGVKSKEIEFGINLNYKIK